MADHSYTVTIDGSSYTVNSDKPLSDVDAYSYAKSQHESDQKTADPAAYVKRQNETMRANMAKQTEGMQPPDMVKEFERGVTEGTTPPGASMPRQLLGAVAKHGPGAMLEGARDLTTTSTTARGEHPLATGTTKMLGGAGVTGGLIFAPEIAMNPITVAGAMAAGVGGDLATQKAAELAGADPETQQALGAVASIPAGIVGAKGASKLPVEPIMRFASDAITKAPGSGAIMRLLGHGTNAALDAAGELGARARGPLSDIVAPGTADPAANAARTKAALDEATVIEAKTKADQQAEATRTNKRMIADAKAAEKAAAPKPAGAGGRKNTSPVDVAEMMRQRLGGTAGQDAEVAQPHPPMNGRGPEPIGTGLERNVDEPLHVQQARMEAEQIRSGKSPAEPPNDRARNGGPAASGHEAVKPQDVANSYAKANGFPEPKPHTPVKVDPEFGKKVADAFAEMHHDPEHPDVKKAYAALAEEVQAQFKHITEEGGLKVEPAPAGKDPYANSKEMRDDIEKNGHLYYYPSEEGFGPANANDVKNNPLLAKGSNGMPINDQLRVVHDYLAHGVEGHGFGPNGEENAFLTHLKMLSKDAGRALATETRGQNSFVNFGPHMRAESGALIQPGEPGWLHPHNRPFADQKTGLLPDEVLPPSLRRGTPSAPPPTGRSGGSGGKGPAGATKADDMLTLEHRSGREDLTTLDPTKQGSGQAGAEKSRQSAYPEDYIPRSYSTVAGGKVEPRFAGSHVYTTEVPKKSVYDFREDPLKLLNEAKAQSEGQPGRMPSVAEKLAHDKGFTTVTFDGNTYQHTTSLPVRKGSAPQIELLDAEGAGTNGSGESKASSEALRRFKVAKGNGSVVIEQAGRPDKPVIDADHFVQSRDNLAPGQTLVRIDASGKRTPVDVTRSPIGAGNKATSMQDIAGKAMQAPDAASARKVAGDIIERERGTRLSAADKKDMVARVMDIIAERRRAINP